MILDTNALSAFADGEAGAVAEVGKAPPVAIPVTGYPPGGVLVRNCAVTAPDRI